MKKSQNPTALVAALAWLAVPVLWAASVVLARGHEWEGSPMVFFQLGTLALMGAGVFAILTVLGATADRGMASKIGIGLLSLAVATSVISWAIVLWITVYAIAALVLAAAHPPIRDAMGVIGGAMVAAVLSFTVITTLEIGTPDEYGDYPLAFGVGVLLSTAGAAAAMFILSRRSGLETETSPPTRAPAAV